MLQKSADCQRGLLGHQFLANGAQLVFQLLCCLPIELLNHACYIAVLSIEASHEVNSVKSPAQQSALTTLIEG